MSNQKKDIQIKFPEDMQRGVYSNNAMVAHTRDEFIMDFMLVTPPQGSVVSRVITSPGHMKRMLMAMQDNLAKYERKFGQIAVGEGPPVKGFSD